MRWWGLCNTDRNRIDGVTDYASDGDILALESLLDWRM